MTYLGAIKSFGSGVREYVFPDTLMRWSSNFARLMTQSTRLPGLDGGVDQYGSSAAPSEIGQVSLEFVLLASTAAEMFTKKDALNAIAAWGKQRLWMQPYDLSLPRRWCNARLRELLIPEDAELATWKSHTIRILFEVPEARWYSVGSAPGQALWGASTSLWGDAGTLWGGTPGVAYDAPLLDIVLENTGNARSPVSVELITGVGETLNNPRVERIENGIAVERLQYSGIVPASTTVLFDAQRLLARVGVTDVYDGLSILRSTWLSALPGTNTFRISSTGGSDACTVKITFREAFY